MESPNTLTDKCPAYSPFFGVMGATSAMVFTGNLF